MKQFGMLLIVGVILILAACGSQPAAVVAVAKIDLSNLPVEVDVATAAALQKQPDVVLIDVREQSEYDAGHIPGVTLIPMADVATRLSEIPQDKTVIVTCRSGRRSGEITEYLRQQGYDKVHNMQGGILAWEQAGLPVEK
jgi:rhodanese-related sulfurtransferase